MPTGVEISHRAAGTNLLQMVFSIDLEGDFEINGASWLPLYHDMGLMMVGFPILYGGNLTFMSPMAFVRRPGRWIQMLHATSRNSHIVSPAPNFAFELVAQRGLPKGDDVDLSNVIFINGSEPVSLHFDHQIHRSIPAVWAVQDRRPAVLRNGGGDAVRVVDQAAHRADRGLPRS